MDIPTINTAALTAPQAVAERESASPRAQSDIPTQRRALEHASNEPPTEDLQRQRNFPEIARTAPPARALGPVRFEVEEGTRVAKFFDTKDFLIYQVPPEGQIYLVRAQETAAHDRVDTEA